MATKKKESHTGFRNGAMFCFNCGGSFLAKLPMPVFEYSEKLIAFDKLHTDCVKTWTEPIPEPEGKTMEQNIEWWIKYGERGMSSCTILYYLTGRKAPDYTISDSHPCDPDDFSRCYKLLQAVPQLKTQLQSMSRISTTWAALVHNWAALTSLYEDLLTNKKGNGMYDFMKTLVVKNFT